MESTWVHKLNHSVPRGFILIKRNNLCNQGSHVSASESSSFEGKGNGKGGSEPKGKFEILKTTAEGNVTKIKGSVNKQTNNDIWGVGKKALEKLGT